MTDFTHTIGTKSEYTTLIKNENDLDVNKVLLFTKKDTVAPVFKALSAEFRDRLRFNVVPVPDTKASKSSLELKESYEVEEVPQLIVEQTYDPTTGELLTEPALHRYKSTSFKFRELKMFLQEYARSDQKEELQETMEQKEEQKTTS